MPSIGIDLVEIIRIKRSMARRSFLNKILGSNEYAELESRNFPPQSVAVNFCAKEAFLKALGKGLGDISLTEIELLRKESGQPYLKLSEKALELAEKENLAFSVSATHTENYASVVVLAYNVNENL